MKSHRCLHVDRRVTDEECADIILDLGSDGIAACRAKCNYCLRPLPPEAKPAPASQQGTGGDGAEVRELRDQLDRAVNQVHALRRR